MEPSDSGPGWRVKAPLDGVQFTSLDRAPLDMDVNPRIFLTQFLTEGNRLYSASLDFESNI